jgi:hypothetical protein
MTPCFMNYDFQIEEQFKSWNLNDNLNVKAQKVRE